MPHLPVRGARKENYPVGRASKGVSTMQDPQNSSLDVASLSAVTTAVFRQAAFEQRDRLNISELGTLLSSLAIRFKVHTAPVGESPAVA